jgi:hypothetical protein
MPRTPIDYSKACVYRLVHNYITYYIGSTTNFTRRKYEHKRGSSDENREEYNRPIYSFIRETGGWDNDWCMVLVQEYPECKTSNELLKYEREHYDFYKPELNMNKPCLKEGERIEYGKKYYEQNADNIKEKSIQYYRENIEKCKENIKQYRIENAEKLKGQSKERRIKNVDQKREFDKQYYSENSEKLKERSKQYYTENAEKLKEKHNCECGSIYTHRNESQHIKTQKHIKYCQQIV